MKMRRKEIIWLLLILMLATQLGCGTKTSATKKGAAVKREVFKW